MANDVEENPGPTFYDIVDQSKTICADFSQSHSRKFGHIAGKQCVAMILTAIVQTQVKDMYHDLGLFFFKQSIMCGKKLIHLYP